MRFRLLFVCFISYLGLVLNDFVIQDPPGLLVAAIRAAMRLDREGRGGVAMKGDREGKEGAAMGREGSP